MPIRTTKRIEVGTHENKAGFTVIYSDDTRDHFLFKPDAALLLAKKLEEAALFLKRQPNITEVDDNVVIEGVDVAKESGHVENIPVSESVNVGLVGGDKDEKKIH